MANFQAAVKVVLENEGGYVNDPNDPGGETNFGITAKYLNHMGRPCKNMRDYTVDEAISEYRLLWNSMYYALIHDDALATSVFSAAINMGDKQAVKLLQRAYNSLTGDNAKLKDDGILGIQTLRSINQCEEKTGLLDAFKNTRSNFYRSLVEKNPTRFSRFLKGWLKVASR